VAGVDGRLRGEQEWAVLLSGQALHDASLTYADVTGQPTFWAGVLPAVELGSPWPPPGRWVRCGFVRCGFFVVRTVAGGGSVAAAVPATTERLPFGGRFITYGSWRIGEAAEAEEDEVAFRAPGAPTLLARRESVARGKWISFLRVAAFLAAAMFCVGRAARRSVSWFLLKNTAVAGRRRPFAALAWWGFGAACLALAADASWMACLAVGIGALAAAPAFRSADAAPRPVAGALWGAACAGVWWAALELLSWLPALPSPGELPWVDQMALAACAIGFSLGAFALAPRARRSGADAVPGRVEPASAPRFPSAASAWSLLPLLTLSVAAVTHDRGIVGMCAFVAAAAAIGAFALRRRNTAGPILTFTLVVWIALWVGVGIEARERSRQRGWVSEAARALDPAREDRAAADLTAAVTRSLASISLDRLGPDHADRLDAHDLALALWRRSPLKRPNLASAIRVSRGGESVSAFATGLPLAGGSIDTSAASWRSLGLEGDRTRLRRVEIVLGSAGVSARSASDSQPSDPAASAAPEAAANPLRAEIYWLPRPGLVLPDAARFAASSWDGPWVHHIDGMPDDVVHGSFDTAGRVVRPPWNEASRLSPLLLATSGARLRAAGALREVYSVATATGFETLFLTVRDTPAALDAVASRAAAGLVPWLLLAGLALPFALSRGVARAALARATQSYSRRLLWVLSAIAVLPTLVVVILGVRLVETHLEDEARREGDAALSAAQHVLGEYLQTLEPGFSLGTTLDDRLLSWLASVVRADVNLYWGSRLYASSRPESFTGSGLPRRLPGEVYARLAFVGDPLVTRRSRLDGGQDVVEAYAPLSIPGAGREETRLVLSVPRFERQHGLQTAIATLRRRALLAALALIGLLAVVGRRLAAGFARPIQDLVRGTQRIAAGAASSGLAPGDLELAELVDAIDRMARRIAEARAGLVSEKRLVETVVDNIGAAVVTLDGHGRVVLCNRLARERLRVDLGEDLASRLLAQPELASLASWVGERLATPGDAPAQRALKLSLLDGERDWTVAWVPIPGDAEHVRTMLVVEDVSEVVRGQRLEAWAEMARLIAHEIKNPLTPIRLSAEHLREVAERDPAQVMPVVERCVQNILRQVDQLRDIAGDFSTYSRIPEMRRRRSDLLATVRGVVDGYSTAPSEAPRVVAELPDGEFPFDHDPKLLERALRNLIENSLRVSPVAGAVTVRWRDGGGIAGNGRDGRVAHPAWALEVLDRGPGVPPHMIERIFDPYFSTHERGTGLGLPIARQIVEAHGGRLEAVLREGGGLIVRATFPGVPDGE
jgi:nitrogen fixation/metabolism regulation signal transduction histidine kinase